MNLVTSSCLVTLFLIIPCSLFNARYSLSKPGAFFVSSSEMEPLNYSSSITSNHSRFPVENVPTNGIPGWLMVVLYVVRVLNVAVDSYWNCLSVILVVLLLKRKLPFIHFVFRIISNFERLQDSLNYLLQVVGGTISTFDMF